MTTALIRADIGPVSLLAPEEMTRHVVATHGHLWQWTGDGEELYSLSVAVRETRLGTPTGVRHHLNWEVDQVLEGLAPAPVERTVRSVPTLVDGSLGAAATDVTGETHGAQVRHRVLVSTEGEHMHVIRVVVPDTEEGRELADRITASVRVLAWSMPA